LEEMVDWEVEKGDEEKVCSIIAHSREKGD
jgi:hypothetical protein